MALTPILRIVCQDIAMVSAMEGSSKNRLLNRGNFRSERKRFLLVGETLGGRGMVV